jgi:isorenieratene synthase
MSMERGFHAFFRHYYNLRQLMRRWDPELSHLIHLEDYPILGPEGALLRFDRLPKKTPWNVAAVALRGRQWMGLTDLMRVDIKKALAMVTTKTDEQLSRWDGLTARDYLDGLNFPPEARRMLFDVFAHSFFNPEDEMSASELLAMFRFYFTGNPEGLVFDVLNDPFSTAFIDPWAAYLGSLGVQFKTGVAAESVRRSGVRFETTVAGDTLHSDFAVMALEVDGLKRLAGQNDLFASADLEAVNALSPTAPFAIHRLWLDRRPNADRDPFAGTSGLGRLDNISIYERFEGESRRWSERTGGSIVELHAYGLATPFDADELKRELRTALETCYPELAGAKTLHEEWLVRQDCPSFPVGSHAKRPTVGTSTPGLALAGDYIRLPFPSALMERAVTSGLMAANHLLEAHAVTPEPIWFQG